MRLSRWVACCADAAGFHPGFTNKGGSSMANLALLNPAQGTPLSLQLLRVWQAEQALHLSNSSAYSNFKPLP